LVACSPPAEKVPGVVDQVGHSVAAPAGDRVVTLAPDVTELVWALGAGNRLAAVPETADYPPQVLGLPRVNPGDVESILGHRPDLVVASTAGNDPRVVDRLRNLGVPAFTADVTSFVRLREAAELLGNILGTPEAGRELGERLGRATDQATLPVKETRPGALFVVWWHPLIVAAPGTVHHDLLYRSGLENLAPGGAGRYPRLQPEVLLDRRLQVIVTPDEPENLAALSEIRTSPLGRHMAAGRVTIIPAPADEVSRPGPRLPQALAFMRDALADLRFRAGEP